MTPASAATSRKHRRASPDAGSAVSTAGCQVIAVSYGMLLIAPGSSSCGCQLPFACQVCPFPSMSYRLFALVLQRPADDADDALNERRLKKSKAQARLLTILCPALRSLTRADRN